MATAHNLGFPRIGAKREMKKAVEAYWRGELSQAQLQNKEEELLQQNWALQSKSGLDLIPVGDFSWYDHVLDMSLLLNVIPPRFQVNSKKADIDTYFCMARGQAPNGQEAHACEMTKWFDTNYHYIVPEFSSSQQFSVANSRLLDQTKKAIAQGYSVKPVVVGPLSYLWLGKAQNKSFNKLDLLANLLAAYKDLFQQFSQLGVDWVQVDEPILVLDLPAEWKAALINVYDELNACRVKTLLTTYFGSLGDNLKAVCDLPIAGLHIDLVDGVEQFENVLLHFPNDKVLSLGVVNGRNIWKNNFAKSYTALQKAKEKWQNLLWVAPSCSLLHSPVDLEQESALDQDIKSWLSFANQKLHEVVTLARALNEGEAAVADSFAENKKAIEARKASERIHRREVSKRISSVNEAMAHRQHDYEQRAEQQKTSLGLPLLPTTTIGSFPQTTAIRLARRDFRQGKINEMQYQQKMKDEISSVLAAQEAIGLDVLVHGEAERNDMVEYFGELLDGFAFTEQGWVQSYGSRCVKPPIIFGDVSRAQSMTVEWSRYAQSQSQRIVKGMLTGPVTILAWSFVRDDQPLEATALQIALALRDEVVDLESAGIRIIQIDEPAFRESLPLRRDKWQDYLYWAVRCFRIASCGVKDETQIHTHMCYSEFNDIIESIAALDADVITLESSRSNMELLEAFERFAYPNEIGPGVYDIHSPRVPSVDEISVLLVKALHYIPADRLWVNPDCGLKTRGWEEVKRSLTNMVKAAEGLRKHFLGVGHQSESEEITA